MEQVGRRTLAPLWVASCLVGIGGCDREWPELSEAPIRTPVGALEDLVRDELESFSRNVSPHEVRVRRVEFGAFDLDGQNGSWSARTGVVRLSSELLEHEVATVLRHELCHAFDTSTAYFSHERQPDLYSYFGSKPSFRRRRVSTHCQETDIECEVFAVMCGFGPENASATSNHCSLDREPYGPLMFQHMLTDVWLGYAGMDRAVISEREHVQVDLGFQPVVFDVFVASQNVNALTVVWSTMPDGERQWNSYDVSTGNELPLEDIADTRRDDTVLHAPPPSPWQVSEAPQGVPGGSSATVMLALDVPGVSNLVRRFYTDGLRWGILEDGCRETTHVFRHADKMFALRINEAGFEWSALTWNDVGEEQAVP